MGNHTETECRCRTDDEGYLIGETCRTCKEDLMVFLMESIEEGSL